MASFILVVLTLVGIFIAPVLTLGCVLIHFGHPVLGGIAVAYFIIAVIVNLISMSK